MVHITREDIIAYLRQPGARKIVERQDAQHRTWASDYRNNEIYKTRKERPTPSDAFANILEHEVRPFVDTFLNIRGGSPVIGTHLGTFDTETALIIGGIGFGALECAATIPREKEDTVPALSRRSFLRIAGTYGSGVSLFGGAIKFMDIITDNSKYDIIFDKIVMTQYPEELFIPVLSHEYTHFLQQQTTMRETQEGLNVFREGHATGVAFAHAREQLSTRPELAGAFSEFIREQTDRALTLWDDLHSVDDHALGQALFIVAEAKHGPGIYAETLRNPRVVLE